MPPRTVRQSAEHPQSDIYGLGATLHQLFTGDDPSLSLFYFEEVKLRNSSISTQLNALLKQMVEMEMSKRPQSMTVVRQQLQQLLAQQTAHLRQTQTNSTNKVGRRSVLLGSVSTEENEQQQKPPIITYRGQTAAVQNLAWSPDSGTVASAAENVQLWNGLTGQHIFTYSGNDIVLLQQVLALAWSPNGRYLASGGMDRTLQVWNATNN